MTSQLQAQKAFTHGPALTLKAKSCIMLPIPPLCAIISSTPSPPSLSRSCMLPLGSISMALRFVKPSMSLASLPNFWLKASLRLCAGSVEMRRTDLRTRASWMAREQEVVVLPTPPLPPTKIQRRVFCCIMDSSVGSRSSASASTVADMVGKCLLQIRGGCLWM